MYKYLILILFAVTCYGASPFNDNGAVVGDDTSLGSFRITSEGEMQILLTNRSGHTSKRGELMVASYSFDNAVTTAPINSIIPIGVVASTGIANGGLVWVTTGGRAQFLIADSTGSVAGYWIAPSATQSGRVQTFVVEPTQGQSFSTAEHDGECGHALETKAAGTDVLFWGAMHLR